MVDPNPAAVSLGAAAQSLRDTAKWLVGGVTATAAGIFAGSSLTSLGSLDLTTDRVRLIVAGIGVLVGFVGLALILAAAIRVLTRDSVTFREFANSFVKDEVSIRDKLLNRYKGQLGDEASFAAYTDKIDKAYQASQPTVDQATLLQQAVTLIPVITADAGFHLVKEQFNGLICALCLGTFLAIVGFGAFAWAANPPKPSPASPPSITIPGLRCQ